MIFSPAFSNKPFFKRMKNPQGKALAERDGPVRDIRRNLELKGSVQTDAHGVELVSMRVMPRSSLAVQVGEKAA